ncbi:hypothetical protein DOY81_004903 [Sarcophaga bullata]|nr:hypothetical protein DOY81_004903 [Sarcophaga bullata]
MTTTTTKTTSAAATTNNNNNFCMNEFNAMKTAHNSNNNNNNIITTTTTTPPITTTQQQQQHLCFSNNETLINNTTTNNNSINNLLCSNNLNSKVWSSNHQLPPNSNGALQTQGMGGLYQPNHQSTTITSTNSALNSNGFQMESTLNNHCTEAMISSLWGSETGSSSGCSSGSGSQPSLSPTLMSNNNHNNYRSNSKESLWSQQTSPSTSSSGCCSSQLRDTYYTGSTKLTNQSPTSWSSATHNTANTTVTNNANLMFDANELKFSSKINNIWEIPPNNHISNGPIQDLFPEIWTNFNANNHNLTDNISDISSNTSTNQQQDSSDIWRSPQVNSNNNMILGKDIRPLFGSNATNNNNPNNIVNENNQSGLGAAACMQLFSDEFLFM